MVNKKTKEPRSKHKHDLSAQGSNYGLPSQEPKSIPLQNQNRGPIDDLHHLVRERLHLWTQNPENQEISQAPTLIVRSL